MPRWSRDDIARIIVSVGQDMGITPRGIVIGIATGLVESNLTVYGNAKVPGSLDLPHDAVGSDGMSVGVQQQQVIDSGNGWWWGSVQQCQDPTSSTRLFFTRLKKLNYNSTSQTPGSYAQAIQQSAFPDRYDEKMAQAQALYDTLTKGGAVVDKLRPDYNEYPVWSNNCQSRSGTKVDLFLLHTNEADNNADQLARWMQGDVGVAYHYCLSEDYNDHGVTVCDVVDTDEASWSVLSANNRSINLCFAGSRAAWTRSQWLQQSRAIDVAAYLAVQDCKKYSIPTTVIAPPYTAGRAGISDHYYVTKVLGDGTHTDVGPNFPWDVFSAAVAKYAGQTTTPTKPAPAPIPAPQYDPTQNALQEMLIQTRGRFAMLGNQTLVEAVAQLRDQLTGSKDAGKQGYTW